VTQTNMKSRGLERDATCQICGTDAESGYHAVIRYSKAVALRHALRSIWRLPDEGRLIYTGPDWLLHLLSSLDDDGWDKTLLLLWRAWHHWNDIMHGKGRAFVGESVEFLKSYVASLGWCSCSPHTEPNDKGKEKVWEGVGMPEVQKPIKMHQDIQRGWALPSTGWVKLNVDAGYCHDTGLAGTRVVVWDHQGQVILSAWQFWENVVSAEEAEAFACLEGMRLVVDWVRQPTVVESDCLLLIKSLCSLDPSRANHHNLTELKGGPRTRWAQKMNTISL
jgi:hypothetical protein